MSDFLIMLTWFSTSKSPEKTSGARSTVEKKDPTGFFQGASFSAWKILLGKFFIGSFTGIGPEISIIINFCQVFGPHLTHTTCFSWSLVTIIWDILVMAINCQKKVRASSRKKAQVLTKTEAQNSVFSFLGFNLETYRSMTTAGSPSLQRPSRNRVYSLRETF